MISQKKLTEEVRQIVKDMLTSKEVIPVKWLVQSFIKEWEPPKGKDEDYWRLCGYEHVGATFRRVSNRYTLGKGEELEDENESQGDFSDIILEGFERVQKAYFLKRDNERCLVPTELLTRKEAEAKVEELEQMAAGCKLHAEELQRYIRQRWGDIRLAE